MKLFMKPYLSKLVYQKADSDSFEEWRTITLMQNMLVMM